MHINTGDTAWMLVSTALVFFMMPGLALFYGGLVGAKNVIATMVQSFVAIGLISVMWVVVGYTLVFGADHWTAIFADRIKFGSLAGGDYGAAYLTAYQTRDQLAQYFAGIKRDWEMIEYVTENFVAQGDRVVMLGHCSWRNRRTGKVVATPKADSWRFADGKAIEFYEYYDTAQLRDATV